MVSVVLMAGYARLSDEQIRMLKEDYNENYIPSRYKSLKQFRVRVDSKTYSQKPLIQFTMEKLEKVEAISEIVIVGHKKDLESALEDFISGSRKRYKIVDQFGQIAPEYATLLNAGVESLPDGSIAANGIKGYINTDAFLKNEHALFVASDTPRTSEKTIESFIQECECHSAGSSIVFPLASMKELPTWRHFAHRKYLFLVNDTKYQFEGRFKTKLTNRDGFRVSSMVYANPHHIDLECINLGYSMRKLLSKDARVKLKNFLKHNSLGWIWRKYFYSKDLSIKDCELALSSILCRDGFGMKIVPIADVFSSFDYDETREDETEIRNILE